MVEGTCRSVPNKISETVLSERLLTKLSGQEFQQNQLTCLPRAWTRTCVNGNRFQWIQPYGWTQFRGGNFAGRIDFWKIAGKQVDGSENWLARFPGLTIESDSANWNWRHDQDRQAVTK
mgnify:CR=1 FL=1